MTDGDRRRLLPAEVVAMRRPRPDHARVWIDVYLQLLDLHQRALESGPPELLDSLKDEAERIGRRIDYWRTLAASNGSNDVRRQLRTDT